MATIIDDNYIKPVNEGEAKAPNKKQRKKHRLRESYQKAVNGLNNVLWGDGNNFEKYNLVAKTSFFINFFWMQVFRMFSVLALFVTMCVYTYIYLRSAAFNYNFWALLSTLLAFGFLFIGSGKQIVYQKLVDRSKIVYQDPKKKSNLWKIGVFFYS